LHCRGEVYPLTEIEGTRINFRVNTAIASFLLLLVSFAGLGYGYFVFGDKGYIMLLPLVGSFALLRYTLFHYVELFLVINGKSRIVIIEAMRRRELVYHIEDAINTRLKELKEQKSAIPAER